MKQQQEKSDNKRELVSPYRRLVVILLLTVVVFAGIVVATRYPRTSIEVLVQPEPLETSTQSVQTLLNDTFHSMQRDFAELLFTGDDLERTVREELGGNRSRTDSFTVFLTASDGKGQTIVRCAGGVTLQEAYDNAAIALQEALKSKNMEPALLKADIVNAVYEVSRREMNAQIGNGMQGHFRMSVSFDPTFETALLEAELNSNRLIQYDRNRLDERAIEHYLAANDRPFSPLPDTVWLFSCRGYLYEDGQCIELYQDMGPQYGQRMRGQPLSREDAWQFASRNTEYLLGEISEDGSFVYGYHADTGERVDDYNYLRHAGTAWALINQYALSEDETMIEPIERVLDYLTDEVRERDAQTCYVIEASNNQIKLGGNGIAILALAEYEALTGAGRYRALCERLGNGILTMQKANGSFNHVLYYDDPDHADYDVKQEYLISYYDGEATYGLLLLYRMTGDEKWLDAALLAMEHFLAQGEERKNDQWMAYVVNEVTKYVPDERYYYFGVDNMSASLEKIRRSKIAGFTNFEMMMNYFEMYERAQSIGKTLDGFDGRELAEVIFERTGALQNSRLMPEIAMYMSDPEHFLEVPAVREDHFRVRIDDVQHCTGGLHLYYRLYDQLLAYA